jgi:Tfp pilus assembly protein PilV
VRARSARAIAAQSGMTLIEVITSTACSLIAFVAVLALLDTVTHYQANDQERNLSLVEQAAALRRMTQELSNAYELRGPTSEGNFNYVDVLVWLTKSGGTQQDRRVVYNCAVASSYSGQQQCVRYEMPATDGTAVESLGTDANAKSSVAVPRLVNGTSTNPVFNLKSPRKTSGSRPSYGSVTIETPGSGERSRFANTKDYTYQTTLHDAFYMRNLDFNA